MPRDGVGLEICKRRRTKTKYVKRIVDLSADIAPPRDTCARATISKDKQSRRISVHRLILVDGPGDCDMYKNF
jgi:hypothetical protein